MSELVGAPVYGAGRVRSAGHLGRVHVEQGATRQGARYSPRLPSSPRAAWLLCSCLALGCTTEESEATGALDVQIQEDLGGSDGVDGLDGISPTDTVTPDGVESDVPATPGDVEAPADVLAIKFLADDRANRTYLDGQIQFTGSFAWDKATNHITYASSWLPNEREWPRLTDDGPRSAGGGEAEGQVAGDGVFSTEVWLKADEETTLEYGALNEFGNWIWVGPNGQLTVAAGETGAVELPGVSFPKFGKREVEITLDTGALNAEFATITPETHSVFIKGTMNSWTPVQLLDNGKKGDAAEGDGIFTYLHSQKLGAHDGLAFVGQHVQFVFVFAPKEADPADGIEYKFPVDALADGVAARTGEVGGALGPEPVILEPDSYGKVKNTTVVVTGPPPECDASKPCPEGKTCSGDSCIGLGPECSESVPCPQGEGCDGGTCVPVATGCGAGPACGPGQACEGDTCVAIDTGCGAGSPCPEGQECKVGQCVPVFVPECSASDPCDDGFLCQSGTCVVDLPAGQKPSVSLVDPAKGPASGGTPVTISGSNFGTGATVRFGDTPALEVAVKTTGTITALTPPGAFGAVTVTVKNPDGQEGSYVGGFQYTSFAAPTLSALAPTTGQVGGGEPVTLTGTGFQPGAKVLFGISQANQVSVAPGGTSLTCLTPSVAETGSVDVTLQNPDGQSATLAGAFVYKPGLVQFAVLQPPFDLSVAPPAGGPSARVQVYHPGVTPGEGPGAGLMVQLGYGAPGSAPTESSWLWLDATYAGQAGTSNNDDVWQATFPVLTGSFDWGFRVSLDGETWSYADRDPSSSLWLSPGTIVFAPPPEGLALFSLEPRYGPLGGGTSVTLLGQELLSGATVVFGGQSATDVVVGGPNSLSCVAPAGSLGAVDVTVSGGGESSTLPGAFHYTVVRTGGAPTLDGLLSDWAPGDALADDTAVAGWDNNDLHRAWAAFDDQYLYLAVSGTVEPSNAVVLYVDVDFGVGSGAHPSALADNSGALDAALTGSAIKVFTTGFGADYAMGAFGGASQSGPIDGTGKAGIRDFQTGGFGDFHWLEGDVVSGPEGLEVRVARASVGLAPHASGHEVAFFVRIVNQDGEYTSPEGLPSSSSEDGSVDSVIRFWVN